MTVKRSSCRRNDPGDRVGNSAPSLRLVRMGDAALIIARMRLPSSFPGCGYLDHWLDVCTTPITGATQGSSPPFPASPAPTGNGTETGGPGRLLFPCASQLPRVYCVSRASYQHLVMLVGLQETCKNPPSQSLSQEICVIYKFVQGRQICPSALEIA